MTIYDNYLHINTVKAFCTDIAKRNNYAMYDYFWDNHTETKFPGNSDIYSFKAFENYDIWQIKFNLSKSKTVRHVGLDEYVNKYRELVFHLTIKGHQFLYVCTFNPAPIPDEVIEQEDDNDIQYGAFDFFYQDDPYLSKIQF